MKKLLFVAEPFSFRLADAAWLLFRLHLGLSIAIGAGWSKLVNLSGPQEAAKLAGNSAALGPPDWFVEQVANLGFTYPSPYFWAWLAAWGEFGGGLLVAVGLLTRWAGLQLAFQFLLIAFLWYDAPEPLLGMYYQQLLFWGFVLVTVVGGGRYSLDYLLSHERYNLVSATQRGHAARVATTLVLLAGVGLAQAQAPSARVAMRELAAIAQQWHGSLSYLDYTSNQQVTLTTTLNGMQSSAEELVLDFIYQEPEGGQVQGYEKVRVSDDGTSILWDGTPMQIQSKRRLPNQTLQLVLEGRGLDNRKRCLLRRTLSLSQHQFSVIKEVRYDGAKGFITRNKYQFAL